MIEHMTHTVGRRMGNAIGHLGLPVGNSSVPPSRR